MSTPTSRMLRVRVLAALALSLAVAATASAQVRARVTTDRATIWRPGFAVVATVVRRDDVLEVVGREGTWYRVVVPGPAYNGVETGFITVGAVEAIEGGTLPAAGPARSASQRTAAPTPAAAPRNRFWVFGDGAYGYFTANDSFTAVMGSPHAFWFGGGARYTHNRLFVEGSVERFQKTGERVFVFDDTAYGLGIDDRISVTPIMASAGLSFPGRSYTSYVGGGAGVYLLREQSDFADPADDVSETNAAFRVLAGVQGPVSKHFDFGLELSYTFVPDALPGGVAALYDESDLGGLQVRGKILFGW